MSLTKVPTLFLTTATLLPCLKKSTRDYLPHGVAVLLGIFALNEPAGKFLEAIKD